VFCLDRRISSPDAVPRAASGTSCGKNQVRIPGNAAEIEKAFAVDAVYDVKAVGTNKVVIYRRKEAADSKFPVKKLEGEIKLLSQSGPVYIELLRVPAKTAQTLAPLVTSLNAAGITAQAVGDDLILLKSDSAPDSDSIAYLKRRIRQQIWRSA
jgi:hypothetical protein